MTQDIFENAWHNVRGVSDEELQGDPEVLRRYGDILNTEWDGVRHHTRADLSVRAAQFSPFAALSGYDGEIRETARLTSAREELTEERKRELDETLSLIQSALQQSDSEEGALLVRVTYFQEDLLKEGGEYVTLKAPVKKVDQVRKALVLWKASPQDMTAKRPDADSGFMEVAKTLTIPVNDISELEILGQTGVTDE